MALKFEILTGFSKIEWLNVPRESTNAKGKNLTECDHVINVKEVRIPGKPTEIIGRCIHQTNITETPYLVNLWLDDARNVTSAFCGCPAGAEGHCKHTSALFHFVNEERPETKTDRACRFVAPSQAGKSRYPKGQEMDEIFQFKQKCPVMDWKNVSLEAKEEQFKLMSEAKNTESPLYKICQMRETLAQALPEVTLPDIPDLPECFKVKVFPDIFSINLESDSLLKLTPALQNNYINHIVVTSAKAAEICKNTCDQSNSEIWRKERKYRITASRAHKIKNARKDEKRLEYFFDDLTSLDNLESVRYGMDLEASAREKYQELSGNQVFTPGLVIKIEEPWLAASPDGLVLDHNDNYKILEIKCPFSCKEKEIDVKYIVNGKLLESHPYFTQIQLQMYVCQAKETDLFIYSSVDYKIIPVKYDADFV